MLDDDMPKDIISKRAPSAWRPVSVTEIL
jgi:hypothetical protein